MSIEEYPLAYHVHHHFPIDSEAELSDINSAIENFQSEEEIYQYLHLHECDNIDLVAGLIKTFMDRKKVWVLCDTRPQVFTSREAAEARRGLDCVQIWEETIESI